MPTAVGWCCRPVGEATIVLTLDPLGVATTEVTMSETPTAGPGAWVNNRLLEAVAHRRLDEVLGRLGKLAEGTFQLSQLR